MKLLNRLIMPAGIVLLTTAALVVLRSILFGFLYRRAKKTASELDDIIIKSLKTPSAFWSIALGIYSGVAVSDMPERYVHYFTRSIDVLVILSVTLAVADVAGRVFRHYVQKAALPIPMTGLTQGLLKGVIVALGALIALNSLGISITPLVTALGVGGLAVALALQDTLANLFAGTHVLFERSIRVGDFIKLEGGQEGYVTDIGWRTTKIRMLPNNLVIIPNAKLAQSVVVNYYLPEPRMAVLTTISVGYDSDPERVERILVEEAVKGVGQIPGLLEDPAPFVRLVPGFGESSLDFTLICQVREFVDQYAVQHELRKRILKRFREEGIEIPYPQRTIHMKGPLPPANENG